MLKILSICSVLLCFLFVQAQPTTANNFEEVIYARKDGMALTMLVLKPIQPNGKAVLSVVSGGWNSAYNTAVDYFVKSANPFLKEGYTVFLTMHSSNPKYSIPDAVLDIQKAVQFIRFNADKYAINPNNIAITGTSSGGHLSLMAALSNDIKNSNAYQPVDRVSSRIQAVIAFCPLSDFLNFGASGVSINVIQKQIKQMGVWGAFSYTKWDAERKIYVAIEDKTERRNIDSLMSPTQIISKVGPPIYIIHGNADRTVPIQQSLSFSTKYQQTGLPCTLVVKQGIDHDLKGLTEEDYKSAVAWLNSIK